MRAISIMMFLVMTSMSFIIIYSYEVKYEPKSSKGEFYRDSTGNLSDLKVRDSTGKLVAIKDIDSTGKLIDEKPTADDEWQQGDFVTYRRIYPHQRCGGQMVFNGKSERAPYSETDRFYDHVCDKCSTTNQILNATWPQYKREWRAQ
jgi:hypothetical protein